MKKNIYILTMVSFIFTGCSNVLLPYKEAPSCSQGKQNGYCGSVSDVYKVTKKKYN